MMMIIIMQLHAQDWVLLVFFRIGGLGIWCPVYFTQGNVINAH